MSDSSGAGSPRPASDTLPPVERPNAGFILQLFVIPGVIVLAIFVIVGLLRMLAQTPSDPWAYVNDLSKGGEARWRAAVNLANLLRDSSHEQIKRDPRLASELARILDAELKDGGRQQMQDSEINLRIYLCHALGEFRVDRGVDVLVKAATTQRDEQEIDVQKAAIAALAVLSDNLKQATGEGLTEPKVVDALVGLSRDKNELIRSAAAYTLGVIGGPQATQRLEQMVEDEIYPDAQYNAAIGLARSGDPKAIDVLVEMLDPTQNRGVELEKHTDAQPQKRTTILTNALRATTQLADANPTADLSPLTAAIEQLMKSDSGPRVSTEAAPVLAKLKRRGPPAAATP